MHHRSWLPLCCIWWLTSLSFPTSFSGTEMRLNDSQCLQSPLEPFFRNLHLLPLMPLRLKQSWAMSTQLLHQMEFVLHFPLYFQGDPLLHLLHLSSRQSLWHTSFLMRLKLTLLSVFMLLASCSSKPFLACYWFYIYGFSFKLLVFRLERICRQAKCQDYPWK